MRAKGNRIDSGIRDYYVNMVADKMQELGQFPSWRQLKHDPDINVKKVLDVFGGSEERFEKAVRDEVEKRENIAKAAETRLRKQAEQLKRMNASLNNVDARVSKKSTSLKSKKDPEEKILSREELLERVVNAYDNGMDITIVLLDNVCKKMSARDVLKKLAIDGGLDGLTKEVQRILFERNKSARAEVTDMTDERNDTALSDDKLQNCEAIGMQKDKVGQDREDVEMKENEIEQSYEDGETQVSENDQTHEAKNVPERENKHKCSVWNVERILQIYAEFFAKNGCLPAINACRWSEKGVMPFSVGVVRRYLGTVSTKKIVEMLKERNMIPEDYVFHDRRFKEKKSVLKKSEKSIPKESKETVVRKDVMLSLSLRIGGIELPSFDIKIPISLTVKGISV